APRDGHAEPGKRSPGVLRVNTTPPRGGRQPAPQSGRSPAQSTSSGSNGTGETAPSGGRDTSPGSRTASNQTTSGSAPPTSSADRSSSATPGRGEDVHTTAEPKTSGAPSSDGTKAADGNGSRATVPSTSDAKTAGTKTPGAADPGTSSRPTSSDGGHTTDNGGQTGQAPVRGTSDVAPSSRSGDSAGPSGRETVGADGGARQSASNGRGTANAGGPGTGDPVARDRTPAGQSPVQTDSRTPVAKPDGSAPSTRPDGTTSPMNTTRPADSTASGVPGRSPAGDSAGPSGRGADREAVDAPSSSRDGGPRQSASEGRSTPPTVASGPQRPGDTASPAGVTKPADSGPGNTGRSPAGDPLVRDRTPAGQSPVQTDSRTPVAKPDGSAPSTRPESQSAAGTQRSGDTPAPANVTRPADSAASGVPGRSSAGDSAGPSGGGPVRDGGQPQPPASDGRSPSVTGGPRGGDPVVRDRTPAGQSPVQTDSQSPVAKPDGSASSTRPDGTTSPANVTRPSDTAPGSTGRSPAGDPVVRDHTPVGQSSVDANGQSPVAKPDGSASSTRPDGTTSPANVTRPSDTAPGSTGRSPAGDPVVRDHTPVGQSSVDANGQSPVAKPDGSAPSTRPESQSAADTLRPGGTTPPADTAKPGDVSTPAKATTPANTVVSGDAGRTTPTDQETFKPEPTAQPAATDASSPSTPGRAAASMASSTPDRSTPAAPPATSKRPTVETGRGPADPGPARPADEQAPAGRATPEPEHTAGTGPERPSRASLGEFLSSRPSDEPVRHPSGEHPATEHPATEHAGADNAKPRDDELMPADTHVADDEHIDLPDAPTWRDPEVLPDPSPAALLGDLPVARNDPIGSLRPEMKAHINELGGVARKAGLPEEQWRPLVESAREAADGGGWEHTLPRLEALRAAVESGLLDKKLAGFDAHLRNGFSPLHQLEVDRKAWSSKVDGVKQARRAGNPALVDSALREYAAFVERHLPPEVLTGEDAPRSFDPAVEKLRRELTSVDDPAMREHLREDLAWHQQMRERLDQLGQVDPGAAHMRRRVNAMEEEARSGEEAAKARADLAEFDRDSELRRGMDKVRAGAPKVDLDQGLAALRDGSAHDPHGDELRRRLDDAKTEEERAHVLRELAEHNKLTPEERRFEALRRAFPRPDDARREELFRQSENARSPEEARLADQARTEFTDQQTIEQQRQLAERLPAERP
ncbi:LOW QUALITY PROTEIN: mucin-1, partial [Kutzneria sp. 744]